MSDLAPGLCRCCGSLTKYRILNQKYYNLGVPEIYADMIEYCFNIKLTGIEDIECYAQNRLICGLCITKLRDAYDFKKQVENTENDFIQNITPQVPRLQKMVMLVDQPIITKTCENNLEPNNKTILNRNKIKGQNKKKLIPQVDLTQSEDTSSDMMTTGNCIKGLVNNSASRRKQVLAVRNISPLNEVQTPKTTCDNCQSQMKFQPIAPKLPVILNTVRRNGKKLIVTKYKLIKIPDSGMSSQQNEAQEENPIEVKNEHEINAESVQMEEDTASSLLEDNQNNLSCDEAPEVKTEELDEQDSIDTENPILIGDEVIKEHISDDDDGGGDLNGDYEDLNHDNKDLNDDKCKANEEETYDFDWQEENNEDENTCTKNPKFIINNSYAWPFQLSKVRIRCYYCSNYYPEYEKLREHTLEHSPKEFQHETNAFVMLDITRIDCRLCTENITSLEQLSGHLEKVHKRRAFTVGKSGVVPYKLRHNGINCVVCELKFTTFLDLDNHMKTHFTKIECSDCGDVYMDEGSLQVHLNTDDGRCHACPHCHQPFQSDQRLKVHMKKEHQEDPDDSDWSRTDSNEFSDDYKMQSDDEKKIKKPKKKNKNIPENIFSDDEIDDDDGLVDIWDNFFKEPNDSVGEDTQTNNALNTEVSNATHDDKTGKQHSDNEERTTVPKRKRGRPKKAQTTKSVFESCTETLDGKDQMLEPRRKRGRPRKSKI